MGLQAVSFDSEVIALDNRLWFIIIAPKKVISNDRRCCLIVFSNSRTMKNESGREMKVQEHEIKGSNQPYGVKESNAY